MRLLALSGRLTDRGGAARWLIGALAGLRARGIETLAAVGAVDARFDEGARIGPWERVKGLERSGLSARGRRGAVGRLEALLGRARPDVVLVNDVVDPWLLEVVAASGRGIAMVQDHRAFCPGPGKVLPDGGACARPMGEGACAGCFEDADYAARLLDLTWRRRDALARMRRVLVLSDYMARELAAVGVPGARVVPPFVDGIDVEADPGAGRYHLLAGRLTWHKGVDVAREAARHTRLPLRVVGEGGGVDEWVDRAGLARLLAGARSLWLPSRWAEPFGIVGIEALACGVPVIASDVGGVSEWLGDGGVLVAAGDARALARAADSLGVERARALGAAGRERVRRDYAPEMILERLRGEIEGVATQEPRR